MVDATTLTNRFEPTDPDGWVMLAPYGDHPHGELVQRVTREVAQRLVNRWTESGARELPMDFDHRTHVRKDDTSAAGWIRAMEAREDGLYGQVRWTDEGEAALRSGRYRLLSPSWEVQTVDTADHARTRVVEPVRMINAALTNDPNLKTLPFLTNRAPSAKPRKNMNDLNTALGLGEAATEQDALAKIAELKGAEQTLQNRCTELENELQTLRNAQVDADIAQYSDVIDDRDSARELLLTNRAAAVKIFEATRKRSGAPHLITNRRAERQPDQENERPLHQRQVEAVEKIRLHNRCTHEAAWAQARRENPDLFEPAAG